MIGKELSEFVAFDDLLAYLEATVSVWNQIGRRDNKYKARIKITVHEHGIDAIRAKVNERFLKVRPQFKGADMTLLDPRSRAILRRRPSVKDRLRRC